MKKLLFFLILIFSGNVIADEIPDIVNLDPKAVKWNWTNFSMEAHKPFAYVADFTKQEKTSDGTIYLPWAVWDTKNNRWASSTYWSRINCEKDSIEFMGTFDKGLFSNHTPHMYDSNQIGAHPKYMICGVKTDNGDKIYGQFVVLDFDKNLAAYWGLVPERLKKENIKNSLITYSLYQYDIYTGKTGVSFKYTADCNSRKIISMRNKDDELDVNIKPNTNVLDLNDKSTIHLIYTFNNVCALKDKLINEDSSSETEVTVQKINEPAHLEPTLPKISISDAKTSCSDLGFKPKTEKFGKCVLELIK